MATIRQRKSVILFLFLVPATLLFPSQGASAQNSSTGRAYLSGIVNDDQGRPLSGVSITLTSSSGSFQQLSDDLGAFRFREIPSGRFVLKAEKSGFVIAIRDLALASSSRETLEIVLEPTAKLILSERVNVVGNPAGLETVPGSAHYLGKEELARLSYGFADVHHFLRQIPGVNIQEEEGFGLRPNIGLRGSGTERSSSITLMEDGVLIAPAPYAAPAAYYFPTAARMHAIEVRKGSSQIKYGPRTNGGALNLLSTGIPSALSLQGDLSLGEYGTRKLHLQFGDAYEHVGWLIETFQIASDGFKELDGGDETGYDLGDYLAKFRLNSSSDAVTYQELEIKLGYTDQDSDETYLGLTDQDFRRNPYRRYAASQRDRFDSRHEQYQARYFIVPTSRLDLTATLYRNNFKRNWYKLQNVLGIGLSGILEDEPADELAIIKGADSGADALTVRANNRKYYSQGIETVLGVRLDSGQIENLLQFGLRYHEDQEDRFQHEDGYQMQNGTMVLTSRGAPGSNANRISEASAWAFFIQDTLILGRFNLVPGLRYENVKLVRIDYSPDDPGRSHPSGSRANQVGVLIPGFGLSYQLDGGWSLFGGVHRGFSPPGPGSSQETEAEKSVNYELGVRVNRSPLKLDVAAFYNDYDNLLGADTLSSGGSGEGDLFNGGAARVVGLEAAAYVDVAESFGWGYRLPVRLAYTLTDAEFRNNFESPYEPWGNVAIGDELPYLARRQLYAAVGLEGLAWRTRLETVYHGRMRTVAGQGPYVDSQSTDSALVFNLSGEYDVQALQGEWSGASLFLSLRNLGNEQYLAARNPAGARPGLPRTLMGGIRFRLGR